MTFNREDLFRMPWSKTDNPGAWIEITDICNLNCPGCFRKNNLEGHKTFEEIRSDILFSIESTNCSRICISGGEPLMHPEIVPVVRFLKKLRIKPIILSNGLLLTSELAAELKKAGLYQFYLHVDAGQKRPGWVGKSEKEINDLRQSYANILKKHRIQCGFNLTIRRANLNEIPDVLLWYRSNIDRVSHLSLIAFRGIPLVEGYDLFADGKKIDPSLFSDYVQDVREIDISTLDIYKRLEQTFDHLLPCAYLPGTTKLETYKMLIINNIGSNRVIYGTMGSKTIEIYQLLRHLFFRKYDATMPPAGKAIFLLSLFDRFIRKALSNYLKAVLQNPLRLFEGIHAQSLVLQQPFEMIDREANLCDGCVNLMPYHGKMINSCRLEEYRLAGGLIEFLKR